MLVLANILVTKLFGYSQFTKPFLSFIWVLECSSRETLLEFLFWQFLRKVNSVRILVMLCIVY